MPIINNKYGGATMANENNHHTSSQDSIQQELIKLNAILDERLTFDPFSVDDVMLWNIVSERENTTLHPYHFMIIRFGEPFDVATKPPYSNHKRIPVYYTNKRGSKNLKDFSFPIIHGDDKRAYNIIYDPHKRWDNFTRLISFRNPEEFLMNRNFLLIRSYYGKNKFGQNKTAWVLVELDNDLRSNACIIREYTIRGQIWAYNAIMKSPHDFGIDLDSDTLNSILLPLKEKNSELLKSKENQFLKKWDDEEDEYDDRGYDSAYEKDLQDELDYIRQNGGDWIDD